MPAIIETSAKWRADEGRMLVQQIRADISNRRDWDAQRREARAIYYGNTTRPDIHWEGATDIHLPVAFENVERLVPKMNNAFWMVWPYVIVDRVPSEYDPEESRIQEHFMNWAIEYDIEGLFGTTHSWFRNMLIDGNSEVKSRWVTTWRRTCEIRRLKSQKPGKLDQSGKPAMEDKSAYDLLDELFGAGQWFPSGDMMGEEINLTIVESRRPIENVRVRFTAHSPYIDEIEIHVFRPILVKDAPEVQVVEPDNMILPHRTRNIQTAKRVTHQHFMTIEEIDYERSQSRWDPWLVTDEDMATLRRVAESEDERESETENEELSDLRDNVEGVDSTTKARGDRSSIRMYEVYKKADLDHDGLPEEIVLQVSPDLNKVLHVTYLDTLHPHGRRPFSGMRYQTDSDRYYVLGLVAHLAPLNIQANIIINQINDRQTLTSNPFGFYRPMSLPNDPDALKNIKPGDMIPSPDPSGIVFPSWGTAPLADMTLMEIPLMFADRIGVPPQHGGIQSANAPRTARGTLALLSEGNLKIDNLIQLAQREGFQELMKQLFGLYSVFMSDEKHFWATGRDRKRQAEMISRSLLRGNFEFRFRGNTVNTNPEVQRTLAQLRYQVASTNPLYMQDPVKFRELLRDFLEAHSDGTSVERILPDLPGMGAEPHPPMDQADEITAMRFHRPIEALMSDNHLDHMGKIDQFRNSVQFGELDDIAVSMIFQHYKSHEQLAQRQMQMSRVQQLNAGNQGGGGGMMGGAGGNDGGGAGGAEQGIGLSELSGGVE